jgi:hypothetical protein
VLVRFNIQMSSTAWQPRSSLYRIARATRRVMRRDLMRGMKQGENFGDATVAFPKPPGQRRLTDKAL